MTRSRRFPIGTPLGLLLAALAVFFGLAGVPVQAAEGDQAAPRTAVEIGGLSMVLIAANGKLHVFVDRLEDNAPAAQVRLAVTTAEGRAVGLTEASTGLFVGPFDTRERKRDSFLVSVAGPDGTGDAMTEIAYGAADKAMADAGDGLRDKVLIAIVAGLIGLVLGTMLVRRRVVRRATALPA